MYFNVLLTLISGDYILLHQTQFGVIYYYKFSKHAAFLKGPKSQLPAFRHYKLLHEHHTDEYFYGSNSSTLSIFDIN